MKIHLITLGFLLLINSFSYASNTNDTKSLEETVKILEKRLDLLEPIAQLIYHNPNLGSLDPESLSTQELMFRNRLQGHLTSLFGAYHVLASDILERAAPPSYLGLVEGVDWGGLLLSGLKDLHAAIVPGIGAFIAIASNITTDLQKRNQTQKDQKILHIFSSFLEIDITSQAIAEAVSRVYSSQIRELTEKGVQDLADSAGETLKWYVQEKHRGGAFTPDQLIIALGKYYKSQNVWFFHHQTISHRVKRIETLGGRDWTDVGIFLGSGIEIPPSKNGKQTSTYYTHNNSAYCFENKNPLYTSKIYTHVPMQPGKYFYRNGLASKYIDALNKEQQKHNLLLPQSQIKLDSPSLDFYVISQRQDLNLGENPL